MVMFSTVQAANNVPLAPEQNDDNPTIDPNLSTFPQDLSDLLSDIKDEDESLLEGEIARKIGLEVNNGSSQFKSGRPDIDDYDTLTFWIMFRVPYTSAVPESYYGDPTDSSQNYGPNNNEESWSYRANQVRTNLSVNGNTLYRLNQAGELINSNGTVVDQNGNDLEGFTNEYAFDFLGIDVSNTIDNQNDRTRLKNSGVQVHFYMLSYSENPYYNWNRRPHFPGRIDLIEKNENYEVQYQKRRVEFTNQYSGFIQALRNTNTFVENDQLKYFRIYKDSNNDFYILNDEFANFPIYLTLANCEDLSVEDLHLDTANLFRDGTGQNASFYAIWNREERINWIGSPKPDRDYYFREIRKMVVYYDSNTNNYYVEDRVDPSIHYEFRLANEMPNTSIVGCQIRGFNIISLKKYESLQQPNGSGLTFGIGVDTGAAYAKREHIYERYFEISPDNNGAAPYDLNYADEFVQQTFGFGNAYTDDMEALLANLTQIPEDLINVNYNSSSGIWEVSVGMKINYDNPYNQMKTYFNHKPYSCADPISKIYVNNFMLSERQADIDGDGVLEHVTNDPDGWQDFITVMNHSFSDNPSNDEWIESQFHNWTNSQKNQFERLTKLIFSNRGGGSQVMYENNRLVFDRFRIPDYVNHYEAVYDHFFGRYQEAAHNRINYNSNIGNLQIENRMNQAEKYVVYSISYHTGSATLLDYVDDLVDVISSHNLDKLIDIAERVWGADYNTRLNDIVNFLETSEITGNIYKNL